MGTIAWDRAGEAAFVPLNDDLVALLSSRAAAPGSRVDGAVLPHLKIRVKVYRCKRKGVEEPPRFLIEGRLLEANRAQRDELLRIANGGTEPAAAHENDAPSDGPKEMV